tara:strand:- start:1495 stop:1725 length:231 start_codon:yes stop_codon:yes gene_type:complete
MADDDNNDKGKPGLKQFGDKAGGNASNDDTDNLADFKYLDARKIWRDALSQNIDLLALLVNMPIPIRDCLKKRCRR